MRQKLQKRVLWVRSGILHKKGSFGDKISIKIVFLHKFGHFNKSHFVNKLFFFDQKFQNMRSLGDKFVISYHKLKKI